MNIANKHIILTGFKHVGKSSLARSLALKINRVCVDLDEEIIKYVTHSSRKLSCREIIQLQGEHQFRQIETKILKNILLFNASVIALGGGAPLSVKNQELLRGHVIIHVVAPKNIVFEKLMIDGWPILFNPKADSIAIFNDYWRKRTKTYQKISTARVNNNTSLIKTTLEIMKVLNKSYGENHG